MSKMKLVFDEREASLFDKCSRQETTITLSKRVLTLGDVALLDDQDKELLLFERKTLADLLASIKDGRYEEQSYRLQHASGICPHHIVYIIEGVLSQLRGDKEKKIVYSAMTSLGVFKGYSVLRTSSIQETADLLLALSDKVGRDMAKGKLPWTPTGIELPTPPSAYCTVVKKVKKDNITPATMGEIVLCQVPGVSSVSALAIMSKFHSIYDLIQALEQNPNCLDEIVCVSKTSSRKLSKTIIQNIKTYLLYRKAEAWAEADTNITMAETKANEGENEGEGDTVAEGDV